MTPAIPRAHSIPRRVLFWALVLLLAVAGLDQVVRIGDFRIDDAYITFSFSKNMALGNGPVYSHGVRVEGYSNFLWMLLLVPGYVLAPSADVYIQARLLTFLWLAFGLFIVYRMARRGAGRFLSLLAPALVVVCSDVFRAALSGLETIPFAVAIAFGWWIYLDEPPQRRRWSLLAFIPAALMRIDGFVPLLIVIGFEVLTQVGERRLSLLRLVRWLAPAVGIWAAYFAWRYAYYGLPLPSTVYAKDMVDAQEPGRGWNQIWVWLRDYGALALVLPMLLPLARAPRRAALGLWCAVGLQLVYNGLTGGDWMPFQRFFVPVVPLGAVLCTWGVRRFADEMRAFPAVVRAAGLLCAAGLLAFYGVHAHMASVDSKEEEAKVREAQHVANHTNKNLLRGMDLARFIVRRPGEKLVSDYAGVFAVFTDAAIIDMWGLCNAMIAQQGDVRGINAVYGKHCLECYRSLAPDYFHVNVPLVRSATAFSSVRQSLDSIFHGHDLDRLLGLRENFALGRVLEPSTGRALWFLERRRPEFPLVPRTPAPNIRVDYPLEPG